MEAHNTLWVLTKDQEEDGLARQKTFKLYSFYYSQTPTVTPPAKDKWGTGYNKAL